MNKLREKFETYIELYKEEYLAEQCEQITDDFSVKFNIFVCKNFVLDADEIGFSHIWKDEWYNHEELLQIFKEKYYNQC